MKTLPDFLKFLLFSHEFFVILGLEGSIFSTDLAE